MNKIVGACVSQYHGEENEFELLLAFEDGREIGHSVSRKVAQDIASELIGDAERIEQTLIAEMLGALKAAKADILDYWLPNTTRGDDNKALLICRIDKAIDKAEGRL